MTEFRAAFQGMEVDESDEGSKVMLLQKAGSLFERSLTAACDVVVAGVAGKLTTLQDAMQDLLLTENLQKVGELLTSGCDQSILATLLPISQAEESRKLHSSVKKLECLAECAKQLQLLKDLVPEELQKMHVKDSIYNSARALNCELAAVQALARPLKQDETRGGLARRARLMIVSKEGVSIQRNLDMLLNKVAAENPNKNLGGAASTKS